MKLKSSKANLSQYLYLSEIFYSIQGEGLNAGLRTIFVRLAGCPLRCPYCDTKYALTIKQGKKISIAEILKKVKKYPCKRICLTGGEPLWQKNAVTLIREFLKKKYQVSIETSGAVPIKNIPTPAEIIMDLKTPSSTHEKQNLFENIPLLRKTDSIKFVISDKKDFDWAVRIIEKYQPQCHLLISPVWEMANKYRVAEWIKKFPEKTAFPELRLSIQMHKVIGVS